MAPVKIHLKGKHHRHPIDRFGDLAHPPPAPSPNLRTDVIEHGNSQRFRDSRQAEVEVGKIDEDQQVGPSLFERAAQQLIGPPNIFYVASELH